MLRTSPPMRPLFPVLIIAMALISSCTISGNNDEVSAPVPDRALVGAAAYLVDSAPPMPGPWTAGHMDDVMPGAAGGRRALRITYPATVAGHGAPPAPDAAPAPVVVWLHGFRPPLVSFGISHTANTFIADWLASHGYVVVAPDLRPNTSLLSGGQGNSRRDGDDAWAALAHLSKVAGDPGHPLRGLPDTARAAVMGFSRGGCAALMVAGDVAAEAMPEAALGAGIRVLTVVSCAPPAGGIDLEGLPRMAFGELSALPVLLVSAENDGIAPVADQTAIARLTNPATSAHVVLIGANHGTFRDRGRAFPTDGPAKQQVPVLHSAFRRAVTAWLGAHLRDEEVREAFAPWLPGGREFIADPLLQQHGSGDADPQR